MMFRARHPLAAAFALLLATFSTGAAQAAPSAAPAPAPAAEPCPRLEPGRALGRFSLGTKLTAPDSVEPDALPGWSRPKDPAGKSTRLRFDTAGVLTAFDAPLPACVTLPSPKPHEVRTAELRSLAAALGTCGPEDIREGGTFIPCAGLSLVTSVGASGVEHRLAMRSGPDAPPAPTATCDTWLDADGPVDVTGRRAPPAAPGVPGELEIGTRRVCLSGRSVVFTAATRPADVTDAACTTEANRGGTHVRCGRTLFSFEGPHLALARIRVER
ncbi:hypothetical protein L6V77_29175 [Myxococcota bacterium]|nr:hypothetical protein [Myxococcota bacterium]